jgi:hypothetical protein
MATEPQKRILRWDRKFDVPRTAAAIAAQRDRMQQRFEAATVALCAMEENVRQVLNEQGVPSPSYVWYLDFGRQLFRLSWSQGMAGTSLAQAAQVLSAKWQARGLNADVLAVICKQVFSIGATP